MMPLLTIHPSFRQQLSNSCFTGEALPGHALAVLVIWPPALRDMVHHQLGSFISLVIIVISHVCKSHPGHPIWLAVFARQCWLNEKLVKKGMPLSGSCPSILGEEVNRDSLHCTLEVS